MSTAPIYEALLIPARQACGVAHRNGRRNRSCCGCASWSLSPPCGTCYSAPNLFVAARIMACATGSASVPGLATLAYGPSQPRQLINEVLGSLVTEFVRNFDREDATPYQRSSNASLLGRVQAIKLIRHRCSNFYPKAQIHKWLSKKCRSLSKKGRTF